MAIQQPKNSHTIFVTIYNVQPLEIAIVVVSKDKKLSFSILSELREVEQKMNSNVKDGNHAIDCVVKGSIDTAVINCRAIGFLTKSIQTAVDAPIHLKSLEHGTNSIKFPSINLALDAGTGSFHTENDSSGTLILCPHIEEDDATISETTFQFKISECLQLDLQMKQGTVFLMNAHVLTHRQCLIEKGSFPTVVIGGYSNKKFGSHFVSSLKRVKNTVGVKDLKNVVEEACHDVIQMRLV